MIVAGCLIDSCESPDQRFHTIEMYPPARKAGRRASLRQKYTASLSVL